MSKRQFRGSCHCGKIRFEADIDFSSGTGRCNCSFCTKDRYWGVHIAPQDFRLLQGELELISYWKKEGRKDFRMDRALDPYENNLPFCGNCGVHSFSVGNIPEIGGLYVSVNVACLDEADFEELMKTPLLYMNGRDDDWFTTPKFTGHL